MAYLPLYAERRCLACGYWRGEHSGASTNDREMLCPVDASWFQVTATFVPGPELGRDFNRDRIRS